MIAVTRAGLFMMSLVIVSQMEERLMGVGSFLRLFLEEVVVKMDLRASLGFLMNIANRTEPYLSYRVRFVCFMVGLMSV